MLDLQGITKTYGDFTALEDVSLTVPAGKVFGLLGPNGAGKTSLIRIITRITGPDAGQVLFEGRPMRQEDVLQLGYLPEERGLYKRMKVLDHLVFFGSLKGLSRGEARRRGQAWLDRLGLADRAQGKVEDLSKGMQQKIQFAGTLLHEPELILLDEPFSGLDPINAEALKDIMLELKRAGRTVIFSTHMMDQAEKLCDEIALINKGQLVLSGALSALRASFGRSNLRVRFVGDAGVLRGDARVVSFQETEPGLAELRLADGHAPGEVLREWSARLDIDHFEVIVPSLHNIFIQTVTAPAAAAEGGAA